ncbi:MAG TPA: type II toxin-antitoxin system Phd/YefM family antitoxin [Longimicrobiaceae bacterium]|nr:type II toxin-antitoxin system Phd/YefM family antitoxin [Longimicrobiaceae bacterium]
MIALTDIYSLTEFQRKTRDCIQRLKDTGQPHVLTVNGKAEIVVQDADAYQRMLDVLDQAEALIGIRRGLDSMHRGEGKPADQALADLRRSRNRRSS